MISKEISKIIKLTKIMLQDSYQNPHIIDKETGKINKKSPFFWMIIILCGVVAYISYYIINYLQNINQQTIFLNFYFLILTMMISFQVILMSTNVFYYSKDMEKILPLPLRPVEILLAKLGNLLCIVYVTEVLVGFIPITLYGMITKVKFAYYIYSVLVMFFVPILIAGFISIIMMVFMKLSKFIKNKDVFQVLVTAILLIIMFLIETIAFQNLEYDESVKLENEEQITEYVNQKMSDLNKYMIPSKLSIEILSNSNNATAVYNSIKLISLTAIILIIFIFIGKFTYLKNILKGTKYLDKKKRKKVTINKINLRKGIGKLYISKEFKTTYRNISFLLQCIGPVFVWLIAIFILVSVLLPNINEVLSSEEFRQNISKESFDIQIITTILGLLQVLYAVSNISITSVSRDGKNAIFMKYIPVDLYKQIWYKSIQQIVINEIVSLTVLIALFILIKEINIIWLICIFIIATIINIINSLLMVLVDLKRPNLNWNSEYQLIKQNSNKIFQYILTIIIVLLLIYMTSIFQNFNSNIYISMFILFVFFAIILLIISKYIKKKQFKIFKNIY